MACGSSIGQCRNWAFPSLKKGLLENIACWDSAWYMIRKMEFSSICVLTYANVRPKDKQGWHGLQGYLVKNFFQLNVWLLFGTSTNWEVKIHLSAVDNLNQAIINNKLIKFPLFNLPWIAQIHQLTWFFSATWSLDLYLLKVQLY